MQKFGYSTKTEFIREAVRDKIKDLEKEEALKKIDRKKLWNKPGELIFEVNPKK